MWWLPVPMWKMSLPRDFLLLEVVEEMDVAGALLLVERPGRIPVVEFRHRHPGRCRPLLLHVQISARPTPRTSFNTCHLNRCRRPTGVRGLERLQNRACILAFENELAQASLAGCRTLAQADDDRAGKCRPQGAVERDLCGLLQRREGIVENDHIGLVYEQPCDAETLALAGREQLIPSRVSSRRDARAASPA